jgi:hypothetical protein
LAELEERSIALAAALNAFFRLAKLLFLVGCAAGITMECIEVLLAPAAGMYRSPYGDSEADDPERGFMIGRVGLLIPIPEALLGCCCTGALPPPKLDLDAD